MYVKRGKFGQFWSQKVSESVNFSKMSSHFFIWGRIMMKRGSWANKIVSRTVHLMYPSFHLQILHALSLIAGYLTRECTDGNLPIKTLVARQQPTNMHTYR